jgi:transcriptional regulator with XRE-family HTH domain
MAKMFDVSPSAISRVIRGKSKSDRIIRGIARIIGADPKKLLPDHYTSKKVHHKPKKGRRAA